MPYWRCEIPFCLNLSLLIDGDCFWCGKHLCAHHVSEPSRHRCLTLDRDARGKVLDEQYRMHNAAILSSLNMGYAIALAESLRPGYTCSPPSPGALQPDNAVGYGRTLSLEIGWDDGTSWIIKIRPHRRQDPPMEALRMSVLSEMTTMIALRKRGAKVPEVHLNPALLEYNGSGLPFFFVNNIDGITHQPLTTSIPAQPSDHTNKVIRSIAHWYMSLEQATFDSAGSITLDSRGKIIVGPITGRFIQRRTPPFYSGPFASARDRYLDHFDTMLEQLRSRDRGLPGRAPLDYLAALELRSLVAGCGEMEHGPWYVKHGHDRGDHYRFDHRGELLGVVNWEWSYTTCKAEAFAAPMCFLTSNFDAGSNNLAPYELALMDAYSQVGRIDLARLVRGGKPFQRLGRMLSGQEIKVEHLNATRRAFLGETDGKTGEPKTGKAWAQEVSKRFRHDVQLKTFVAGFL